MNMALNVPISLVDLILLLNKLLLQHFVLHLFFQKLRMEDLVILIADIPLSKVVLQVLKLIVRCPLLATRSLGHFEHPQPAVINTLVEFPKRVRMEIIVVKECKPFDPVESGQIFRLLHQQKGLISLVLSVFVVTLGSINLDFLFRLVFPNESAIAISFVKLGMPSLWS